VKGVKAVLGIDIGGTKIAGGLVDTATGAVFLQDRTPTLAAEGGNAVLTRAIELARKIAADAAARGLLTPEAVGIGAGGQIDARTGVVLSATDLLPGWAGTRLTDAFTEALGIPAAADNDVNALAVGECRFGAGEGFDNLVYLALGTGVGGAIISNGRLHYSRTGVSGELGHLILAPDGLPCSCGGRGCLEQYASGPALLRQYRALGGEAVQQDDGTSLSVMAEQYPNGPAARAIALVGDLLGIGLVSLANIFGPDRIIIGGGLARLGDRLLDPARRVLAARALPAVRQTPVVTAALGPDASIVGAASLTLV
jgi:glucokinase